MAQERQRLLILGSSTRAAAYSAWRAGLQPWCADYFGDADLEALCPVERVREQSYPYGLLPVLGHAPAGPWLYTGALENRPELIRRLAARRALWGIEAEALRKVRAPLLWSSMLREAGLPAPAVHLDPEQATPDRQWLTKGLRGAGGARVRRWDGQAGSREVFYQEFIEGDSCSSLYVGDGHAALLLGSSRQLIGVPWLNGPEFKYCGNIGPLDLPATTHDTLVRMGNVLAKGCGLRGLFGIDFVLRGHVPFPIEINPRYSASVEVLEHALGIAALELHRDVFQNGLLFDAARDTAPPPSSERYVGKAILYAARPLTFPADGPWQTVLQHPNAAKLPDFGDIPHAGEAIEQFRPVLTCFASGVSPGEVETRLQERAGQLQELLWHAMAAGTQPAGAHRS